MRKRKSYSKEIKLQAVSMYLDEGISSPKIAESLGISSRKLVLSWVKRYEEHGELAFDIEIPRSSKPKIGRPKKDFNSTEEKMAYLEAENAYLRLMIELDNTQKKS